MTKDEWDPQIVLVREEIRFILERNFGQTTLNFWIRSDILASLLVQQLLQMQKYSGCEIHHTQVEKYMEIITIIAKSPFLPDFSKEFCVDLKKMKSNVFNHENQ